jgi:hypothetical protein
MRCATTVGNKLGVSPWGSAGAVLGGSVGTLWLMPIRAGVGLSGAGFALGA